jgi:hypothetical protein
MNLSFLDSILCLEQRKIQEYALIGMILEFFVIQVKNIVNNSNYGALIKKQTIHVSAVV